MATRKLSTGHLVFGVAAGTAVVLVIQAEARRRAEAQRMAAAEQLVLTAVHRVASVLQRPMPPVLFHGCENARTDGHSICFSPVWALNQLAASCRGDLCTWNRVLGVVAHEFGHMIDPYRRTGRPWDDELRADWYAGWILGMLGVSPEDMIVEMQTWLGSETHPPGYLRAPQVLAGYHAATSQLLTG